MCMKKHVLVKKNVYKCAKHGFATTSLSCKDSGETPYPVKKKLKKKKKVQ